MADNWLDQTHPEYDAIAAREVYAWDHYTGEALDKARNEADQMQGGGYIEVAVANIAEKISQLFRKGDPSAPYLLRRAQGETLAAYKERLMISRFPRHFARIAGSMVGSINLVDSKAKRSWGALGDPEDESSFMFEFWSNVDGSGTNYPTMLNNALVKLIVSHRLWYGIDPDPVMPRALMFDTTNVKDWLEMDGRLVQSKVFERVDVRESLTETLKKRDDAYSDTWMLYGLDGFQRWKKVKGDPVLDSELSGTWDHPFYTDNLHKIKRLPIGRVEAGLSLEAGYRVAQSCNSLFNLLSDARNLLRVANHPRLRGKDVTKEQWEMIQQDILRGGNTLLGDFDFINPDPSNAKIGYGIYRDEVREVYVESFQTYEDAARERTATEINTDDTRGRRSILSVFSDAMDEFENDFLFLLEQVKFPDKPSVWGQASVQRSNDFKPIDPEATADRILDKLFPLGTDFPVEVTAELKRKIIDSFGVTIDNLDELLIESAGEEALIRAQEEAENAVLNGLEA